MRMLEGVVVSRMPLEGEDVDTGHVSRRQRQRGEKQNEDDDVPRLCVMAGRDEDLILCPIAREEEETRHRESADKEGPVGDRHLLLEATQVLDFLVLRRMNHGARAEEEEGFEEGVSEKVKH